MALKINQSNIARPHTAGPNTARRARSILISTVLITCLTTITLNLTACGLIASTTNSTYPISFVKGELNSEVDKDLDTTWKATQKVVTESQFVVKSTRADAFSAVLKCEDAQARKIDITLEKDQPKITRVKIRVGLLGDAELSGKIFEQIRETLKK